MACSTQTSAWYAARIAAIQANIEALEAAIAAFAGGAQQYTLDTGQTRQTVTRQQLGSLKNAYKEQLDLLGTIEARQCGAVAIGRPAE
jgi:hypothetical protein